MRVAVRRIGLAEPVKTSGDVGQIMLMQANLRMPASVAAAVAGSEAVVNAAGISVPARPPDATRRSMPTGARTIAEAARAAGVAAAGPYLRHRRRQPQLVATPTSSPRSRPRTPSIAGFDSATILRPSVVFGPDDALFNRLASDRRQGAVRAGGRRRLGQGPAGVRRAMSARPPSRCWQRPDTAKSVFELGGPRVYTYREIAALVLLEIDRQKPIIGVPAGLMKLAGFFAQQIARVGLVPPITADQVELMRHDNIVRPGANSLATLGIQPTAAEAILPTYLDRFRIGGRYNQHAPA